MDDDVGDNDGEEEEGDVGFGDDDGYEDDDDDHNDDDVDVDLDVDDNVGVVGHIVVLSVLVMLPSVIVMMIAMAIFHENFRCRGRDAAARHDAGGLARLWGDASGA